MEAKLEAELQLLKLTRGRTKSVVEKGNIEKITRHKETLGKIVASIEDLKLDIEKGKLEAGKSIDEVDEWGKIIEQTIDDVDKEVEDLNRHLEEAGAKAINKKREEEEALLAKRREDELNFEKLKLEQKSKMQSPDQPAEKPLSKGNVKMPKLVITKYDGTYEKWLSFWNKFKAEIDAADIPPVTKFAHLKELLESDVCESIDGLPFSPEGYERAKNILKSNYGKTSEIVRAYIDNINGLPVVTGCIPNEIHKFCQTLNYNVQSLETLGKLSGCLFMVRGVLDKLPDIKADLVSGKPGWQDWGFGDLMQALEEWKAIHPMETLGVEKANETSPTPPIYHPPRPPRPPRLPRDRSFYARQGEPNPRHACVYCDRVTHRSWECENVTSPAERRRILQNKRLCFNCTGPQHSASQCRSRASCVHCKQRHHSSICDRPSATGRQRANNGGVALTATQEGEKVCHPIVLVKLNGVTCRALLDTGATASYASGYILDRLNLVPARTLTRRIQTIVGIVTKRTETYNTQVSDTKGNNAISLRVTRVDRAELLSVENPNYKEMISKYRHLEGVSMEDTDTKSLLPVHVILGASDYAKIKTRESQRTGAIGEPVAEYTLFGWTIMSPGTETDLDKMFLAQTASNDYEELYRMDVLGLEDKPNGDQSVVYEEFLEQLSRSPEGWYETGLPWKGDHPPLPSNKSGSLKRLGSLVQRLKKTGRLDDYDAIIQEQLNEGIIEEAEMPATQIEFYIPHKAVVRESAETTKMRIVYDASARAYDSAPSLNDCLEVGPPLQNQLWKVLLRGRFHSVAIAGDIRKAFLQVRIREQDRDALRFHWLESKDPFRVRTYRFTRALFGLGPSPFLLGGVIQHHLNTCRPTHPDRVAEIEQELYVDDLISGGGTIQEAKQKKATATEMFHQATFHLHKWHSNVTELELTEETETGDDLSYAKQQLGIKPRECGLLGLKWNKLTDEIEKQKHLWLLRVQSRGSESMEEDRLCLNLQKNKDGLLECRGRLQGVYPIYIPDATTFANKYVEHVHKATLHGGVGLTMAKVREEFWIPRLRRLAKKVIRECYGCKRFQAVALAAPPPGLLPLERTEGSTPFEIVGVDFAGPIKYRKSSRVEGKGYLVLYTCSLTRALYLEVLPNLETTTFLSSLKRFIARRGRPLKIFSDNGKTFVGAANLLKGIQKDEQVQGYLASEKIIWRFNLSRAPWWGGQFERLVGLFKRAFYKVIGGGMLSWSELCEVVLDVETQLNRRPLSYVEDDVQLPLLTPSSFLFQRCIRLPEQEPWREETTDLRKRAKYLRSCKDAVWRRWSREYLAALRERHNCNGKGKARPLKPGDVVLIRSEEKNRGKWPLGVVVKLFNGRDGIVRGVKLRAGKTFLERPIQHLYPMELACDRAPERAEVLTPLNAKAPVFRPRRDAAVAANLRIRDAIESEEL